MRVLATLLAIILWLTPMVQVFAGTMAETHCRVHGHLSATAPDAAHDAMHAHHHGASQQIPDAGHCKCGCICDLAFAASAALAPSLMKTQALAPEHYATVFSSAHPHSIHAVLQRPPISS